MAAGSLKAIAVIGAAIASLAGAAAAAAAPGAGRLTESEVCGTSVVCRAVAPSSENLDWTRRAQHYMDDEAHRIGVAPSIEYVGELGSLIKTLPLNADAAAHTHQFPEGPASHHYCVTTITPAGAAQSARGLNETFAHEVFHCIESNLIGYDSTQVLTQPWVTEGLATWVGLTEVPDPDAYDAGNLRNYFTAHLPPLHDVVYPGVGFFGHVEDVYHDLWSRIPAIVRESRINFTKPFAAAGGDGKKFLDTWGASAFQDHSIGGPDPDAWVTDNPIPNFAEDHIPAPTKLDGTTTSVFAPKYSFRRYQLEADPSSEPVIHVHLGDGHGFIQAKEKPTDLKDRWFCAEGGSCKCPANSMPQSDEISPITTDARLGVASASAEKQTDGSVTFESTAEFCRGIDQVTGLSGSAAWRQYRPGTCSITGAPGPMSTPGSFHDNYNESIDLVFSNLPPEDSGNKHYRQGVLGIKVEADSRPDLAGSFDNDYGPWDQGQSPPPEPTTEAGDGGTEFQVVNRDLPFPHQVQEWGPPYDPNLDTGGSGEASAMDYGYEHFSVSGSLDTGSLDITLSGIDHLYGGQTFDESGDLAPASGKISFSGPFICTPGSPS
jgi:hypothetical protein